MGEVYKVLDTRLDRVVAIKVPTIKQLVHARKPGHRTALNSPVGCEATTAGNLHQSPQLISELEGYGGQQFAPEPFTAPCSSASFSLTIRSMRAS